MLGREIGGVARKRENSYVLEREKTVDRQLARGIPHDLEVIAFVGESVMISSSCCVVKKMMKVLTRLVEFACVLRKEHV